MPVQDYQFHYGPKLVAGQGAAARLRELLPPGPCLFVTDATVRALGLADAALAALPDAVLFDAVGQDPSRDTLMAAVATGEGCASVVGFGGGSPMDVAKLAAYLLGSGDDLDAIWPGARVDELVHARCHPLVLSTHDPQLVRQTTFCDRGDHLHGFCVTLVRAPRADVQQVGRLVRFHRTWCELRLDTQMHDLYSGWIDTEELDGLIGRGTRVGDDASSATHS